MAIGASVKAGVAYFAIVFAVAFGLGTLRVLIVAPVLGALVAVLVEVPVVLGVAWFVCRALTWRLSVPDAMRPRLTMGGVAFGLLLLAELGGSIVLNGQSPVEFVASWGQMPGLMGLIAQIGFALIPLMQMRRLG